MGVRGLKSFIDENGLLHPHRLHDTSLVIDGCNLQFVLYWRSTDNSSSDHVYGGDYVRYGAICRQFLTSLLKCKIDPVVVFDGGMDVSYIKFKTIYKRYKDRFSQVRYISNSHMNNSQLQYTNKIKPKLAHMIFLSVLTELNITYLQSTYEADNHIAMLGNYLNCPVMSNDSDFFVYDLTGGLITYDSVDSAWHVQSQCDQDNRVLYKYISCSIYHIHHFLDYFPGLHSDSLALFSTLMGNDYVETKIFDNVFNGVPDVISKKRARSLKIGKRYLKMVRLLDWLRDRQVQQTVDFLINYIKTDYRKHALELLNTSLENYQQAHSTSYLVKYLSIKNKHLNHQIIKSDHVDLPHWFVSDFHKCLFPSFFMNIITKNIYLIDFQINDFTLPSSHTCSLKLRKYLYAFLRLKDNDLNEITEYDRKNNNIGKTLVKPSLYINGKKLPHLFELRNSNIDQRRFLLIELLKSDIKLFDDIKVTFDKYFINSNGVNLLHSFVISVKYWISKAKVKVWIEFIYSLLINFIYCTYIDTSIKNNLFLSNKQLSQPGTNLNKYWTKPVHNKKTQYQPRIVHFYSQLQSCIYYIVSINALLESPLKGFNFSHYFNGNFIYNLTSELKTKTDPLVYLSSMVGKDSTGFYLFTKILDILLSGFDDKYILKNEVKENKNRNKKTEKNIKKDDLQNKFSLLTID